MIKVLLCKSLNVRSGEVPLRLRLKDGDAVDVVFDTGRTVEAVALAAFGKDGAVRSGASADAALVAEIGRWKSVLSEAYLSLVRSGAAVDEASLRKVVSECGGVSADVSGDSVVERFRRYLAEEHSLGRFSDKKYRESYAVSRKLERYLAVRRRPGLRPGDFTGEMVEDFERFCVDEYLYAADPKYASLYPHDYEGSRLWPKARLSETAFSKQLYSFQGFWNDLVAFGEIESSPYAEYVPWMQEKEHRRYTEMLGDPVSLNMDEFQKLATTPVPERLALARNAFILQLCTGCRGEEFKQLSLRNVAVSPEGIPYIQYTFRTTKKGKVGKNEYEVEVPLVRIAFDIVLRTRFQFVFGSYNMIYNNAIQELLRFCGITREVCLYNNRTGKSEMVRLCDVMSQGYAHRNFMDFVNDGEQLRRVRVVGKCGVKAMSRARRNPLADRLRVLNTAFGQKPFRVDANLNVIEGAPFVMRDPLVYREQPEKLPGGRTNPYVLSKLVPVAEGDEGSSEPSVVLRYAPALLRARPVLACGEFLEFMASLEEDEHREWIQQGVMLLKILGDYEVTFVRDCKDTVFSLWAAPKGYSFSAFFYLNGGTVVLLDGCMTERFRRARAGERAKLEAVRELRWKHVIGEVVAEDYDGVLDEAFGERGSAKRELFEMRSCSRYVSQSLRKLRIDRGLFQNDIFSQWGFKDDCGNLSHAECGTRVLPFKYLERLLPMYGMRAEVVRPSLDGWNALSCSTTLEKLREEAAGEKVYRWRGRKI
jgi:hypothetical protein